MDDKKLTEIVNQSGFPLQIGIAKFISDTGKDHGWKVRYTEHAWKNPTDGTDGFIDLVIENNSSTWVMLLECKRVLESSWIFLKPERDPPNRRHAKAWISHFTNENFRLFDWKDITLEPRCPESGFCVIYGHDQKSKPLIERLGAELVSATKGLASEEKNFLMQRKEGLRIYFSVIITTAKLKLCQFSPADISLQNGMIKDAKFEDVPFLRFRKQLSTQNVPYATDDLNDISYAKEHTVFIVHAEAIADFLTAFELDRGAVFQ